MLLIFMDVFIHCCCHSAEQQKEYDGSSHMVLKILKKDQCTSSENSLTATSFLCQWMKN